MSMRDIYKFSIVSAVYNTADYLEEMIESVINQDIGFEENIQLLLIDDESTDNSLAVCKAYQEKYPNNIVVFTTKHAGVSHARNIGLQYAKGAYINFLDSDDKLEINVLNRVNRFFEEYEGKIDLVAIPMRFFGSEEGEHVLNYKFYQDDIIDIFRSIDFIQLSSSSTFIKRDEIGNLKFDEELSYGEDAKFISQVILKKNRYGVISQCYYLYRRRIDESSAIQTGHKNIKWFIDYLENFSLDILGVAKKSLKQQKGYLQYLVMYDLQYRFNMKNIEEILSEEQQKKYISLMKKSIKNIDYNIIIRQKQITYKKKILILLFKTVPNRMDSIIIKKLWFRK